MLWESCFSEFPKSLSLCKTDSSPGRWIFSCWWWNKKRGSESTFRTPFLCWMVIITREWNRPVCSEPSPVRWIR